jgi:hypothetical protein
MEGLQRRQAAEASSGGSCRQQGACCVVRGAWCGAAGRRSRKSHGARRKMQERAWVDRQWHQEAVIAELKTVHCAGQGHVGSEVRVRVR